MNPGARHRIITFGVLFISAVVALAGYGIVRSHDSTVHETGRELDARARMLAEQTVRSLQAVDVVLRQLVEQQAVLGALTREELHGVLRDKAAGLVQADGLVWVDPDGSVRAISSSPPALQPQVTLTGAVPFELLRNGRGAALMISGTMRSPGSGRWLIPIGRRLSTPSGEFAGAIGALGNVDYFQSFYRDAFPDDANRVGLVLRDGTLLARHPATDAQLGRRLPQIGELVAAAAAGENVSRGPSPVDGVDRFAAIRIVPDYPLAVVVTRDAAAALAPWREAALGSALRTLALAALAAWLMTLVLGQFRRLDTARASLETSEERYALAAAGSDDGIWDWDLVAGVGYESRRARELQGLPLEPEMQPLGELRTLLTYHPDDAALRRDAMQAHLDGRTPAYEVEYRVRHPDGQYRWIGVRALCIRDAAAKPLRIAGSVTDVDARKRAEVALRESEQRFAAAVQGSDDGIWEWDYVRGRAFASARAREIIGVGPGPELQSIAEWFAQMTQVLHPQDQPRREAALAAHLRGDTPAYEGEFRVRAPEGGWRWLRVHGMCSRDASGQPLRIAGSVSDIDARKRAEDELRLSEERYALAMTGLRGGHWVWDVPSDGLFVSGTLNELFGLPAQTAPRLRSEYFAGIDIHAEDRPRIAQVQQELVDGDAARAEWEYRIVPRDGSPVRWIVTRAQCFRDEHGRAVRIAGVSIDATERKRTEEALRQSEERYALAMTGSHEGHWVWDMQTREVYVSAALADVFGFAGGAQQMRDTEYFVRVPLHPDDRDRVHRNRELHIAGVTPRLDHEFRILRPGSGEVRWLHSRGQCFCDAQGRPQRMAGSTNDITERKRTEEALRESEERFALALEGANDGILDWDIVRDRFFASERAVRLFGLEPDGIVRTRTEWAARVMPRFHPDDRPRLRDELRSDDSISHEGEYRVLDAQGVYRWMRFRGRSVRDESGRAIRWAGSMSDIDASRRTQEALRRSEERFQLAVDGSNEGLWDWDLATDLLFLSPRAQALSFEVDDAPLRPRRDWLERTVHHPDDVQRVREALAAHLRGQTPHFAVEYRLRHHSGAWHWYRQRGLALRDSTGRPYRMAGSMEDITERKNAEVQRERLEQQLRQAQKLEAIGTLAGGIAHDFNNILAAILGYGEMAQQQAPPGTPLRRHLDAALAAGARAKSLVERILAFSRSGMGERVPVHVGSVVAEALDGIAASLPRAVALERRIGCGDAGVLGDPTQIHQVVMNLCANAVQAMRGSGTLEVGATVVDFDAPRTVTTSILPAGRYLRVTVRDSGSGIEPRLLERIFDPFFTTKEVGVGTGLGLSLVHGIVTDLGGGIAVESRLGAGTLFTVDLPYCGDAPVPIAAAAEPPAPGNGETILLVDDEEALVRLGEETLAALGYEAVGFVSSRAALEAVRAEPRRFDAVLSDETMPGLTGSELAVAIRALRPDIPIVLMSGFVGAAMLARSREAGVAEVLAKPLAAGDIARCLSLALAKAPAALHGAAN